MVQFDKEELRKIASLSSLRLEDQELDAFASQITTILDYMEEFNAVELSETQDTVRNINVFREDTIVACDSAPLLDQAPETHETYFVVPRVIEDK